VKYLDALLADELNPARNHLFLCRAAYGDWDREKHPFAQAGKRGVVVEKTARRLGLQATLRVLGRPRENREDEGGMLS